MEGLGAATEVVVEAEGVDVVTGTTVVVPETIAVVTETTEVVLDAASVVTEAIVVDAPAQKPVRRGLPPYWNPVFPTKSLGIHPESWLFERFKTARPVMEPNPKGMEPDS